MVGFQFISASYICTVVNNMLIYSIEFVWDLTSAAVRINTRDTPTLGCSYMYNWIRKDQTMNSN